MKALVKFEKVQNAVLDVRFENETTVMMFKDEVSKENVQRLIKQYEALWSTLSEEEKRGKTHAYNTGYSILVGSTYGRYKLTPEMMDKMDREFNA